MPEKNDFNGIRAHGLFVSIAVLCHQITQLTCNCLNSRYSCNDHIFISEYLLLYGGKFLFGNSGLFDFFFVPFLGNVNSTFIG